MTHAHRVYRGTPQATLTPVQERAKDWPVDLGELRDLRTTGCTGAVKIELSTTAGLIKLGFGLDSVDGLVPSYFAIPPDRDAQEHARPTSATSRVRIEREKNAIPGATTYFSSSAESPTVVENADIELRRINEALWEEGGVQSVVVLEGLLPKGFAHEGGTSRPVNRLAINELEFLFDNLTYLRATRRRPFRMYSNEVGGQQKIGYGGEWTATILQDKRNVAYAELPGIPPKGKHSSKSTGNFSIKREPLPDAVRRWLSHLGMAQSVESIRIERNARSPLKVMVTLPGQERHNLTEVGFGVSQVLPVLTAGLSQPEGSLFIVDLPEAHLHPKPQADLADFFCSLALSGRYSLVETHSEMFFHRLRLRAEMIPELRNEIAVFFVDGSTKDKGCSPPRPIGLGLDEEPDWPAGFFQEGWDMEVQISSLRRARKTQQK
jgi:predicted ATPase